MYFQCSVCENHYTRDVSEQEYERNTGKLYCSECKRITPHEPKK